MFLAVDEHPRHGTTMEKLAALRPLHPEIEGFSITPGDSSGSNDGAAALVIVDDIVASADRLETLAVMRGWASVGIERQRTGLARTLAIPDAPGRVGLGIDVATRT